MGWKMRELGCTMRKLRVRAIIKGELRVEVRMGIIGYNSRIYVRMRMRKMS